MVSPVPTRRVLGDLSVNTPTEVRVDPRSNPQKAIEETPITRTLSGENITEPILVGGEKRKLDNTGGAAYESPKRARREVGVGAGLKILKETEIFPLEQTRTVPKQFAQCDGAGDDSPSSRQTTPDSSFDSSQATLNDSHHTVFTEPDDTPFPAAANPSANPSTNTVAPRGPRPLTRDQLRQKARDGMLRLRFASYKVRTNQVDVPMAQLQIRSSSHPPSISFGESYAASSNQQHQKPILTGPQINLLEPSSPKEGGQMNQIPSSPPHPCNEDLTGDAPVSPRKEGSDDNIPREGFATPLLPRQRDGLFDPPRLGSPTPGTPRIELTSSVVKGRAADGLLSLMGRKE